MSIAPLPNDPKRVRAQAYDPATGKMVSVAKVLGLPRGQATWPNTKRGRRDAHVAVAKASDILAGRRGDTTTVGGFRDRWLTDSLFARPKESTMRHNAERTKAFADRYGDLPIDHVTDFIVAQWLAGGKQASTVPALRAMFNDAASAKAGRLIGSNPFAGLGLAKTRGNRDRRPPSQQQLEELVSIAWRDTPPSFAGYLEFACVTGIRPSELDALTLDAIDHEAGEIQVVQQWSAKLGRFDTPKYGPYTAALTSRAAEVLHRMPRDHDADRFVFTTTRGTHYTPSSRTHHWNRVRAGAGMPDLTLYLATRHYFGSFALNVLGLPPHVIAVQLGHKDGGKLVTQLYGHPDDRVARQQIRSAFDQAGRVTSITQRRKDAS